MAKKTTLTNRVRLVLIIALSFVAITAAEVAWQYNYPTAHAAANFTLNDRLIRANQAEAEQIFADVYEAKTLVLVNENGQEYETNLAELGALVDSSKQIEQLFAYPSWQRFVPYSYLLNFFNAGSIPPPNIELPDLLLKVFPAQEAIILNQEGLLSIEPSADGLTFDAPTLQQQLSALELNTARRQQVASDFAIPRPLITTAVAQNLVDKVRLNSEAGITIAYNNHTAVVPQTDILSWLNFTSDEANGTIELALNEDELRNFVSSSTLEAPVATVRNTVINYTDGVETSRSTGTAGITVDYPALWAAIKSNLLEGPTPISLNVITQKPKTEYVDTYTSEYIRQTVEERRSAFGGTFIDVNLTTQHLIYIKDAHIIFDSAIVTGRPSMATPPGTYQINQKATHVTLVGEDYRTPVSYWMPFVGNSIGMHDATWQSSFGGSRWKSGYGSHGCVNMPYGAAAQLYSLISVGDVVYVHW